MPHHQNVILHMFEDFPHIGSKSIIHGITKVHHS